MAPNSRGTGAQVTTNEAPPPSWRSQLGENRVALVVVHSSDEAAIGRVVPLQDELIVVGRHVDGSGISLDDRQLSRVHFRVAIDPRSGGHRLGDAQSRNGTIVDGGMVDSGALRPGSVIRAGESVFVYGDPDPLATIREHIAGVARSDLAVLIAGETGTGKERLARAVHQESGRSGPFVAINCGAVVRDLLAAELFGHARGAFSGAVSQRAGLFRSADRGTLFLDEVADLPLELQPALLRVLQEGVVRPLGTDEEIRVDVRVVAATHVNLESAVRAGKFRVDLHARLARAVVELPPLRERRTTILSLARSFADAVGHGPLQMTANAAEALVRYDWPYNVRELESLVHAFVAEKRGALLDTQYLRARYPALLAGFRGAARELEGGSATPAPNQRSTLEALLVQHEGNVSSVASTLGKPRSHVYRWLKNVGLDPRRFREKS
jgi:DNA-binding NtrC family response regulator